MSITCHAHSKATCALSLLLRGTTLPGAMPGSSRSWREEMAMPSIRMQRTFSTEATLTMWDALLAFTKRAVLQLLAAGAVNAIASSKKEAPAAGRSDL